MRRLVAWRESEYGLWRDTNGFLGPVYLRIGDCGITFVTEGEVIRVPASRFV